MAINLEKAKINKLIFLLNKLEIEAFINAISNLIKKNFFFLRNLVFIFSSKLQTNNHYLGLEKKLFLNWLINNCLFIIVQNLYE